MSESDKLKIIGPGLVPETPPPFDPDAITAAAEAAISAELQTRNMIEPSVQSAHDERSELRKALIDMEAALRAGASVANLDDPEGTKTMTLSATLAGQWANALTKMRRYL